MPAKIKTKAAAFNAETSLKAINGNIALLRKNSNAFRDLLQTTLVLIATHADRTGDCNAMARLMNDGLTNWYRRGPICEYINDFTPIVVTFKAGVAQAKFEEKDQRKPFNIDGMKVTPFWEHKSLNKDNELPMDTDELDNSVAKLADRLTKKIKDKAILPDAVPHAEKLVTALRAVVSAARVDAAKAKPEPEPKKGKGRSNADDAAALMAAAAA